MESTTDMAPYYETLATGPKPILGSPDKSLLDRLRKKNADELAKIQTKLEDAETNLGETEISDALRSKAAYLARIGEKVCGPMSIESQSMTWIRRGLCPLLISFRSERPRTNRKKLSKRTTSPPKRRLD